MKNYGYQNEFDFVELFNDKNLDELNNNSKLFLKDIFGEIIDSEEKIIAWKNKVVQKADIFIKYKGYIKRISLKCGNGNSIHHEQIQEFNMYLKKLEIPYKFINIYNNYHYGYLRDKDGNIDFENHVSSEDYKKMYQEDIDSFNEEINKTKIIIDMVDRFIIRGRNSEYDIDALICGTIDDYVWIKKYEIYDLILSKRKYKHTSPHISCLTIGPKKRNLNGDSKNWKEKYIVCIRWNFIRESIIEFKNNSSTTVA